MNIAVIIDIVLVLILAGLTLFGAKRGLFQSLAGLVIVVLALFGAAMVADFFAPPIAKAATPVVEKYFQEEVQEFLQDRLEMSGIGEEVELEELFRMPELQDGFLAAVMERAEELTEEASETAAKYSHAAIESLIETIVYGILFALSFILLLIVLRILGAAMGLLTKLPGVHGLNALGGAVLGLVEGVLLVFLIVFILEHLSVPLDTEIQQEAHILKMFRENTPLEMLLSLL